MVDRIAYTLFPNARSVRGTGVYETIEELAHRCSKSYKHKMQQPLVIPNALPDQSRAAGTVPLSGTAIFLDYDRPALSMKKAFTALAAMNAACVVYPTYSYDKVNEKYRVALPLASPLELHARRALAARYAVALPGVAVESFDSSRGYFVGRNGSTAPPVLWRAGLGADEVQGLPEAAIAPEPGRQAGGKHYNSFHDAQVRVEALGRKLKDGDGRWTAVQFMATRLHNLPDEESRLAKLGQLIAGYFDTTDIKPEQRREWERVVRMYANKDMAKKLPKGKDRPEPVAKEPQGWSIEETLDLSLPPVNWLVAGLLPPGLALLAGPPKAGKSRLALDLGLHVAAGREFLGAATSRCKVMYYDLESGIRIVQDNARTVMAASGLGVNDVRGQFRFELVLDRGADAVAQVRAALADNEGVRLVIVDIFAQVRGESDRNKSAYQVDYETVVLWRTLTEEFPGLCVLLVHHTNKKSIADQNHWSDAISGTMGMSAAPHTNMVMSRIPHKGISEENQERMKYYIDFRIVGKEVRETEMTLRHSGKGTWIKSDLRPWEIVQLGTRDEIVATMRKDLKRAWTASEMANELGKNKNTITEIMRRMSKKGNIKPTGGGYLLAESVH